MSNLCFLCGLLTGIFLQGECTGQVSEEIFGNMTYKVGNENASEEVTLINGEYMESQWLHVWYENQYVYGDFNNDGQTDAAVIIVESGGGSANFPMLAFLIHDGHRFVHRQSYDLGNKTVIHSLKSRAGKVFVSMSVRDETLWAYGRLKKIKKAYEYTGPTKWGPNIWKK